MKWLIGSGEEPGLECSNSLRVIQSITSTLRLSPAVLRCPNSNDTSQPWSYSLPCQRTPSFTHWPRVATTKAKLKAYNIVPVFIRDWILARENRHGTTRPLHSSIETRSKRVEPDWKLRERQINTFNKVDMRWVDRRLDNSGRYKDN